MAIERFDDIDAEYAATVSGRAIQSISQLSVPATPGNYAVWFHYMLGTLPGLRKTSDILLDSKRKFDFAISNELQLMSGHGDIPTAAAAIKGGAVDLIQKLFKSRDLLDQLGKVVAGFSRSNHKVVKQMISSVSFPGQEPLTRRERDVLQLVATGSNNKTIGETLGISYRTVEEYRSNIMHKLRAKNVAELLVAVPR